MMKVLNLYAGIGGNRKLWDEVTDVEVTAVEIDPEIASVYTDIYPDDEVIIGDAHEYLLKHYDEGWDFIWSSPPCPSHSRPRYALGVKGGKTKAIYPDLKLYEEIIFLDKHIENKWVVENVVPYYQPLIKPRFRSNKNYIWSNFHIPKIDMEASGITEVKDRSVNNKTIDELENLHGFDLSVYEEIDKRTVLRNCVHPKLGKHILKCALYYPDLDFFISGDDLNGL